MTLDELLTQTGWPDGARTIKGSLRFHNIVGDPPEGQVQAVVLRRADQVVCRVTAVYPPDAPAHILEGTWSTLNGQAMFQGGWEHDPGSPQEETTLLARFQDWVNQIGARPVFRDMGNIAPAVIQEQATSGVSGGRFKP